MRATLAAIALALAPLAARGALGPLYGGELTVSVPGPTLFDPLAPDRAPGAGHAS